MFTAKGLPANRQIERQAKLQGSSTGQRTVTKPIDSMKYPPYISGSFKLLVSLLIFMFQSAAGPLMAQDTLSKASSGTAWHFRVEPYMMFPNMVGSTGIGALPLVEVDAASADILSRLQMGGMLFLEASNGNWSINSDFLYMNLEQDLAPDNLIAAGKINARQLGWELAGLKRVNSWLEFGVGGLLNAIEMEVNIDRKVAGGGTVKESGKKSKTWVDPMLIARFSTPGGVKKFAGQFRGEVGGFGIGSDFAWQVQAVAGYRFSKLFDMTAGYRAIGLDYNAGNGNQAFIYDMVTHGPVIRFAFNF